MRTSFIYMLKKILEKNMFFRDKPILSETERKLIPSMMHHSHLEFL